MSYVGPDKKKESMSKVLELKKEKTRPLVLRDPGSDVIAVLPHLKMVVSGATQNCTGNATSYKERASCNARKDFAGNHNFGKEKSNANNQRGGVSSDTQREGVSNFEKRFAEQSKIAAEYRKICMVRIKLERQRRGDTAQQRVEGCTANKKFGEDTKKSAEGRSTDMERLKSEKKREEAHIIQKKSGEQIKSEKKNFGKDTKKFAVGRSTEGQKKESLKLDKSNQRLETCIIQKKSSDKINSIKKKFAEDANKSTAGRLNGEKNRALGMDEGNQRATACIFQKRSSAEDNSVDKFVKPVVVNKKFEVKNGLKRPLITNPSTEVDSGKKKPRVIGSYKEEHVLDQRRGVMHVLDQRRGVMANTVEKIEDTVTGKKKAAELRAKKQVVTRSCKGFEVMQKSNSLLHALPEHLSPFIRKVKNVASDGNCGYRAIAELMGFGEHDWMKVRHDLYVELTTHEEHYKIIYQGEQNFMDLKHALNYFEPGPAPEDNWMVMPDMGHLIASAYNIVLFYLSTDQCLTFLPLRSPNLNRPPRKEIAIGLVHREHFVQVFCCKNHPIPPIATNWTRYHLSSVHGWDTPYGARIQTFRDIVGSCIATDETFEFGDT